MENLSRIRGKDMDTYGMLMVDTTNFQTANIMFHWTYPLIVGNWKPTLWFIWGNPQKK